MEIWSKCDICGRAIPVGELCYGLKKGNCICKNCCTGFENCTFTLAPMPTITPPNEWVSVEERLPEKHAQVLMWSAKWKIAEAGSYYNQHFWVYSEIGDGYIADNITHWMPLPAPPGKDNNVPINKPLTLEFDVVDTTTGKYPDWERIALEEAWAKGLVYCDMDGVAIRESGSLVLLDECGNCVSCPPDRFEIRRPPEGENA